LIAIVSLLAACGSGGGAAQPQTPATSLDVPLNVSFAISGASYAIVPMGDLSQPLNTFWQMLMLRPKDASWALITPPGVADNGGLVIASSRTTIEAGFVPSAALAFSPIVATPVAAIRWHALGLLPAAFSAVPDSFAGAPGKRYALVATGGGKVVVGSPTRAAWRQVLDIRQLSSTAAGQTCGVVRLSAIATAPDLFVGASCTRPVAGVFSLRAGRWSLASIRLPSAFSSGSTSVLRLIGTTGRTTGLTALISGGPADDTLAAAWSYRETSNWMVSPPLDLGHGAHLVATGFGPQGQQVVLWRTSVGQMRSAVIANPRRPWLVTPVPPTGTEALVAGPGWLEALAVDSTSLTVWRTVPPARAWSLVQRMHVPIVLGSSG
jgi:hypothetical protein